jgi:hypothetical protein
MNFWFKFHHKWYFKGVNADIKMGMLILVWVMLKMMLIYIDDAKNDADIHR